MPVIHHTVFVGGGPAGLGPLVYAAGVGELTSFLRQERVAVVEQSSWLGKGTLGAYQINANSKADLFLACLREGRGLGLPNSSICAAARLLGETKQAPPLSLVSELLQSLGGDIRSAFQDAYGSSLLLQHEAKSIHLRPGGGFDVHIASPVGVTVLSSRNIVLGIGAYPYVDPSLGREVVRQCRTASASKILYLHSDGLLRSGGLDRAAAYLSRGPGSRVLIIGSGDSAFSVAWLLRNKWGSTLREGAITLAYRSAPKVTFESIEAAHRCGYDEVAKGDVCTESGIVNRIGGLRFDAKSLYLDVVSGKERRVQFVQMSNLAKLSTQVDLSEYGVVVFATGYRSRELPFYDAMGRRLALEGSFTGRYVDGECRLLESGGEQIPNAYAIGMCSGLLPMDAGLGGEPNFVGLANSIFLCLGPVGRRIFESLKASY